MLTFGPWGALSRPPATQGTLKQPPRKETFNFSSLSVFFGRIFLFLLCVGDSTSSCSCTSMIACLLCKLKQIPVFICIFKCSAKIHPHGTCFMICVNALLPFQCFVQILICRILHVGVICGIDSMSPIVLQDTLVLTAIMLGVPCPISKVILASKVWVGGEGCGMITAI